MTQKEWLQHNTRHFLWAMVSYHRYGDQWYLERATKYLQWCRIDFQAALTERYING